MKVVLDTGVVLSALLFPSGRLAWLPGAWRSAVIAPAVSRPTTEELIRALAFPKFGLDPSEVQGVLGAYLPWTESIDVDSALTGELPTCQDPADQKFLELAAAAEADALVASDRALLALADETPFPIWKPSELRRRLGLAT